MKYPNINMEKTGKRLKCMLEAAGITPKMLQSYLHLSCVQPIYRWYKGIILPSVNHLFMLSELLGVHMEELLVKEDAPFVQSCDVDWGCKGRVSEHILKYCKGLYKDVA